MKFQLTALKKKKHLALVGESGSSNHLHSLRDWSIGLGLAALVFLAGITYVAYDFYEQFIIESHEVSDESLIQYHPERVHMQAEEYNRRERIFNELRDARKGTVVMEEAVRTTSSESGEISPIEASLEGGVAGDLIAE